MSETENNFNLLYTLKEALFWKENKRIANPHFSLKG
jgi:hypothetical protein